MAFWCDIQLSNQRTREWLEGVRQGKGVADETCIPANEYAELVTARAAQTFPESCRFYKSVLAKTGLHAPFAEPLYILSMREH